MTAVHGVTEHKPKDDSKSWYWIPSDTIHSTASIALIWTNWQSPRYYSTGKIHTQHLLVLTCRKRAYEATLHSS